MPYTTKWEDNGIYWKYTGTVTHEDVMNSNYEFYRDERSDNARYQILDCSELECFKIREDTVKSVAALDYASSFYVKNIKVALISADADVKNIYQQYIGIVESLLTNWTVEIFDDIESARSWLNS